MLTVDNTLASVQEVSRSEHDVHRINSIEVIYKGERQKSKAPTFALTRWSPTA
jgi:hypothetical protein